MDTQTINPAVDPEAAADITEQALESTRPSAPEPHPIPDMTVRLPGGLLTSTGEYSRDAVVRELNGSDEEALAKVAGNASKQLETILLRGIENIGDQKPTQDVVDSLLMADRDALVVAIRKATFGDAVDLFNVICPSCGHEHDEMQIPLDAIPSKDLEEPSDRNFDLDLPSGRVASVTLPTGDVQRALAEADRTKVRTVLLTKTVRRIDGSPVTEAAVQALGMRDREHIVNEIGKRNPGPRLLEVTRSCERCDEEIPLPLTLAVLFRL